MKNEKKIRKRNEKKLKIFMDFMNQQNVLTEEQEMEIYHRRFNSSISSKEFRNWLTDVFGYNKEVE